MVSIKKINSVISVALISCFLVLSLSVQAGAGNFNPKEDGLVESQTSDRSEGGTALPFSKSERLRYRVYWLGIPVGWAELSVKYGRDEKGRPQLRFQSRAQSSGIFSLIFRVDDKVDSYFDLKNMRSTSYRINQQEGHYKGKKRIDFYHSLGKAVYLKDHEKPIIYDLTPGAQDPLSSLYYVRMQDMKVGGSLMVQSFVRRKNALIKVKVLKKEILQTAFGPLEAYKLSPSSEYEGIFKKSGPILAWFSADDLKIPLRMESKVIVGSIAVVLEKIDHETARTFLERK